MTRVAIFGLGEAGSLIAADLVAAGAVVNGFDPADVDTPSGIHRFDDPNAAVKGVDIILGITAQADAVTAVSQAIDSISTGSLYADLSTSASSIKKELAGIASDRGVDFVDIALMTLVPGNGLSTPSLAAGNGAGRYVSLMQPLGARVEVISNTPGDAASRKLLRSIMMKGLASLVIEAMQAGQAAGCADWLWKNLADQLTRADETMLARLVTGTKTHAVRRLHEMEASTDLLRELGIEPLMTNATVESHRRVIEKGVPVIPG